MLCATCVWINFCTPALVLYQLTFTETATAFSFCELSVYTELHSYPARLSSHESLPSRTPFFNIGKNHCTPEPGPCKTMKKNGWNLEETKRIGQWWPAIVMLMLRPDWNQKQIAPTAPEGAGPSVTGPIRTRGLCSDPIHLYTTIPQGRSISKYPKS